MCVCDWGQAQDFLLQLNIMQMRIHNGNELFLYSVHLPHSSN